jgi:hypothetical protein
MSLISPNFPRAAVGLRREAISVLSLQKQGRRFNLSRAATVELAEGVLQPHFDEQNIQNPTEILETLRQATAGAGLQANKKWSVSLPADTARMAIVTLETAPKSAAERNEILNWKAERAFGAKSDEMRVAFQRLAPDAKNRPRYFAVAIRLAVLDEYEAIFDALGWRAGLILPRHVSEAQWLLSGNKTAGDALMISSQSDGFTAILFRQNQPSVVRSVICELDEREDEIYRLLLFYRDRFDSNAVEPNLQKLFLIGDDFPKNRLREIARETLDYDLQILGAAEVGLNLPAEIKFEDIAAPAGLASLARR